MIYQNTRVGSCSICGADVVVPATVFGVPGPSYAPRPHCVGCGAVEAKDRGPVIQMERPALDGTVRQGKGAGKTSRLWEGLQATLERRKAARKPGSK